MPTRQPFGFQISLRSKSLMKSCPTCKRTFEDTFTFCLADGSLLDAPFDPHATLVIPEPRQTEPPPTEAIQLEEETKPAIPPTIASPEPQQEPQESVSTIVSPAPALESPQLSPSPAQPTRRSKLLPLVTILTVILAVLVIILILVIPSNRTNETKESSVNNTNIATPKPSAEEFIVTIKGGQSAVWVTTQVDRGNVDDRLIKPNDKIDFRPQQVMSIELQRAQVMNIYVLVNGRMIDLQDYQHGMGATAGILIDKDSYK
jgi:biopolymer transport protein ExbD